MRTIRSEMASLWKSKGAERLHVVDLDGSLAGVPRHEAVIRAIVTETGLPLQVGGGIREMKTVEAYLEMGVRWVILGTAALRDPEFVRKACREFPDQVILGIDAPRRSARRPGMDGNASRYRSGAGAPV